MYVNREKEAFKPLFPFLIIFKKSEKKGEIVCSNWKK
jgi:hypothetical protein